MRQNVDVLWLIEHIAREMDVACAVKAIAESRYGVKIAIRNIYYHAKENMEVFNPRVIVYPFFYFLKGALATEDYIKTWPQAVQFNLAWEEIHYKAHEKIKAPADRFTRENVIHHAWGRFYKDYLTKYEVPQDRIFVNGQPAYQLYYPPYCNYYRGREWMAGKYGLDSSAKWIFIPENYRWAFIGNKVNFFEKLGADKEKMLSLRDFSIASLKILLKWCNLVAQEKNTVVIFRPRPSTSSRLMMDFFLENIGSMAPNLRFMKEDSVREWILASDVVISSYSTSLIESAIAGKPSFMVEPIPIPEDLQYDWYRHAPHIFTMEQFEAACMHGKTEESHALRQWAEMEMLSNGDPIQGLAEYVFQLVVKQAKDSRLSLNRLRNLFSVPVKSKEYFNSATHENDIFSPEDVEQRVDMWKKVLNQRREKDESSQ